MNSAIQFSPVDLEDLALELGASVKRPDGSMFNAGGRAGATRLPRQSAAPVVAPVPPPSLPSNDGLLMQKLVEVLAQMKQPAPSVAAPTVNIPAPVVTVQQPQRVLDWTFTFERNPDGTIKSIRAKAT